MVRAHAIVALAVAVSAAEAARGLRNQVDTHDLSFDALAPTPTGVSFDQLTSSDAAPGSVREVALDSSASSSSSSPSASSPLQYSRPDADTFFDVVGDLSSKWNSFGDAVPVPSGAKLSLATACGTDDLDACLRACATRCFANNACQWFTLQPSTKDCFLYRSLRPIAGNSFAAVSPTQQLIGGYIKAGVPALLNAKADCAKTVTYNENDSFCVTTDTTYFMESSSTTQCAGGALTLLRTFQNNFFNKGTDTSMAEELKNGHLVNARAMAPQALGGDFSVNTFLQVVRGTKPLLISTNDVKAMPQQLAAAGTTTQWTYGFDSHGRVVSASSTLGKKNLLYTKDATGKMVVRPDYCKPVMQTRFSYSIHALAAVKALQTPLPFNSGEIASSLFTSPNGFWNLVPQSDNSRLTGCWKHTNDAIAKLLEWGFTGEWSAELKYFDSATSVRTQATEASVQSNELFTEDDVDKYYTSTDSSVGDLGFKVDFPCGYVYRPYNMKATFKLTGCDAKSYCSAAWPAIQESVDGSFFSVSNTGSVQISRAFAHWAFENTEGGSKSVAPQFTYLKALATSNAGLCFTETGRSLSLMTLLDEAKQVFLVTADKQCVSLDAGGTPTVAACTDDSPRYNVDGSSTQCIAGSGPDCASFSFTKSFAPGQAISTTSRDDLVSGTLSFGSKGCLVVDGASVSFSMEKASCMVIKASYVVDGNSSGDPMDPDAASEALPVAAATVAKVERIDDPDPELAY